MSILNFESDLGDVKEVERVTFKLEGNLFSNWWIRDCLGSSQGRVPCRGRWSRAAVRHNAFFHTKGACPTTDGREAFRLVFSSRPKRGERNWFDSIDNSILATRRFILRTRRFLGEIILFLSSLLSSSFNATSRANNVLNVEETIP